MRLKKYSKYTFFLLLVLFALQSKVQAGGFPLRPGRFLISPSLNYFYAKNQWDTAGILKPFHDNGQFTSITFQLYMEYGISRRLSFVGSLPYAINDYHEDHYHPGKVSGLTDLETGLKYYFANIAYQYFFTVQGTVISPLYKNPSLGYGQTGAEIKLAFAGSGTIGSKNYYFNVENGVRQYFGSAGPFQDRYNATFGLTLDDAQKNQVAINFGGFYTTSSFKLLSSQQIANINANTNFAFKQLGVSYGHTFSKQITMFINGSRFIAGRNTGQGTSGGLSLIYRIDTK